MQLSLNQVLLLCAALLDNQPDIHLDAHSHLKTIYNSLGLKFQNYIEKPSNLEHFFTKQKHFYCVYLQDTYIVEQNYREHFNAPKTCYTSCISFS